MRKRLAEKLTKARAGSLGFTMTEVLVTVGIIAIICAIAIPSIVMISRSLRFNKCNENAKNIFLAAQQNLSTKRANGSLNEIQTAITSNQITADFTIPASAGFPEESADGYVYVNSKDANHETLLDLVLPKGSIDDEIREDGIIIEFNPASGNVYAVFYADKGSALEEYQVAGQEQYREDKDARKKVMLGYYCGSVNDNLGMEQEKFQAKLEFVNGQEGILNVLVPLPSTMYGKFTEYAADFTVSLTLTGDISGKSVSLNNLSTANAYNSDDGLNLIIPCVLDSLAKRGSFANIATGKTEGSLTTLTSSDFTDMLPGENITVEATVVYSGSEAYLEIDKGIITGINPMFTSLEGDDSTGYTLTVSNGRELQNLNAIHPGIAAKVTAVNFPAATPAADGSEGEAYVIDWAETVDYYRDSTLYAEDEAPARALPYFVPIHNVYLFGSGSFDYSPEAEKLPVLTELAAMDAENTAHYASINGNGCIVANLNINSNSTKYADSGTYYAIEPATANPADVQKVDYSFTGLFGYINTAIDNLHVVNPTVVGAEFTEGNNPATGALVGAAGSNAKFTNCSTYLTENFTAENITGNGAVGGLVGYAKSADTTNATFSMCFAAVNVSGTMRSNADKYFGYTNGVGGLIGCSQLTNFEKCYASGQVTATNCKRDSSASDKTLGTSSLFGSTVTLGNNGKSSWGAGGFVGTSHGTTYTNCFATGDVETASVGGGFVGFMNIDAPTATGSQYTVFKSCYSVGSIVNGSSSYENFSGAIGYVNGVPSVSGSYATNDYYRLYAPYYSNTGSAPGSNAYYIFKDTYFLSNADDNSTNSEYCAQPQAYNNITILHKNNTSKNTWVTSQINYIKAIVLSSDGDSNKTYNTEYFSKYSSLNDNYRYLYNGGYYSSSNPVWEGANQQTTHSYGNISGNYPFPIIVGLDYHGTWPTIPSDIGLAYFEEYCEVSNPETTKISYLFDRERKTSESLVLPSGNNKLVVRDGYAIFTANNNVTKVTVNGKEISLNSLESKGQVQIGTDRNYNVYLLPQDALDNYDSKDFYTTVTVKDSEKIYTMYFNPNVAMSHANPSGDGTTATKPTPPTTLYVRSARQFKALSNIPKNYLSSTYTYVQQLNLDAKAYKWTANDTQSDTNRTINATMEFNATYKPTGSTALEIANFLPTGNGLFGSVGADAKIDKLRIICDGTGSPVSGTKNAAVLAGSNAGAINDVDLTLSGTISITGTETAGLLVGANSGAITNCDVTLAAAEKTTAVTLNAANAGGLVGASTKGSISNCILHLPYAVNSNGQLAGAVGKTENTAISDVTVIASSLNGANAAGLVGTASGTTSVTNCQVFVGVAGTGSQITLTSGGTIRGTNSAAGAAVQIGSGCKISNVEVIGNGSTISGGNAAGFAVTNKGAISGCSVKGKFTINGTTNAAGFAVTHENESNKSDAKIQSSYVSPALSATAAGYKGNSNSDMRISGTNAAGFILTVNAPVTDCYNLGTVNSTSASYGFAGTVDAAGSVTKCSSNVTLTNGGSAFVGSNSGSVEQCYGWYSGTGITTELAKCKSSYFANMELTGTVAIYDSTGAKSSITSTAGLENIDLQVLNGSQGNLYTWTGSNTKNAYPYSEHLAQYPYPMFRTHYGDWTVPNQGAYGVAYYEKYNDDTYAFHVVELTNQNVTAGDVTITIDGQFPDKDILETGYAIVRKTGTLDLDKYAGDKLSISLSAQYGSVLEGYEICELKTDNTDGGTITISAVAGISNSATINTLFADAINVTDNYKVRTADQLANINQISGKIINIDKDIAVDNYTTIGAMGNILNGGNHTLTFKNELSNNWIGTLSGEIKNLTISAGTMSEALVNSLTGTLSNVTLKANSANITLSNNAAKGILTNTTSGTMTGCIVTVGTTLTAGTVNLTGEGFFGALAGSVSNGTVNSSANVNVSYTGSGNVKIGGLIGEMTGGSVTGGSASGNITTTASTEVTNANIGGAFGMITGGSVSGVKSEVTIDATWKNHGAGDGTITTYGPNTTAETIGMFVGYASNCTLSNCSSTAANETFQFLGVAKIESKTYTGSDLYQADASAADTLTAPDSTTDTYDAYDSSNNKVSVKKTTAYNELTVELKNCTFMFSDKSQTVNTGSGVKYYTKGTSSDQFSYTAQSVKPTIQAADSSKPLSSLLPEGYTSSSDFVPTGYFVGLGNDTYGRLYVKAEGESDTVSYSVYWMTGDASGNVQQDSFTADTTIQQAIGNNALYTITASANTSSKYLLVTSARSVYNTDSVPFTTTFTSSDPASNAICSHNGSTWSVTGFGDLTVPNYYTAGSTVTCTIGEETLTVYEVTSSGLVQFTADANANSNYGNQFIIPATSTASLMTGGED